MRPYKTIALSILVALVTLGAFVLATRSSQGYNAADKKTLKVLRKKEQLKLKPTAQEVAAQLPQVERELEDNIPKHLPLKIKVRNLKSEKWARDFALEITNTSDKPIYYLRMFLDLPDVITENNRNLGFPLQYGRGALISFAVPVESDDVPIKPGETYTWRIPEQLQLGWERFVKRRGLAKDEPKKIKFIFQYLNFGDGTGFRFPSGIPFDIHKRRREMMQRESERMNSTPTLDKPPAHFPLLSSTSSTLFLPANFLPVNFSPAKNSEPTANVTTSSSDICCPGSSCQSLRSDTVYCCGEIQKIFRAPCSDSAGSCTTYTTRDVSCHDEFGTYCIEDIIGDPCPPPGATPTPSPGGTPKPSPNTTPTPDCDVDCKKINPYSTCIPNNPGGAICFTTAVCVSGPTADFSASQTGCPGNAYYDGSGCCVCVSENQTCQQGFVWNTDLCECVFAPVQTPTPPADGGGGGGGDAYYCTHYYWVYYESYDGGETWFEVDSWYAGCW
ncbi:MAG TPA: hypothetical protein VEZ40_14890 [Pyrinomonadaceae bacterium]|nr:hypothetical protein [Pyrinomonadaceae bacterium]